MSTERNWLVALALALALVCAPVVAVALVTTQLQAQGAAVQGQQPPPRQQPRPPPAKATPSKDAQRPAAGASDSALKGRVEHLEEQLADMQVVIGTLESLGRGGNAGPAASAGRPSTGGGLDQARLDSLETQIRALASQIEQLSAQMRQVSGNRRGDAGGNGSVASAPPAAVGAYPQASGSPQPSARADRDSAPSGFGSTTVTASDRDPISRMIEQGQAQPASAAPGLPGAEGANPRELYETAYGYLLQQDYGAAEVAFDEFLRRYPSDRLAADAQYWLGETLYVQRRYKPAGQAFLVVIERHKSSAKVPNSLLKLAQSLDQLGQKDCGIFGELESRHPNAPADVRVKARALKTKQGC